MSILRSCGSLFLNHNQSTRLTEIRKVGVSRRIQAAKRKYNPHPHPKLSLVEEH